MLVTTAWLAENLGRRSLVVAEVDENPDLYEEGHIPGAVKLHWRDDLQDPVERDMVERDDVRARARPTRGIGNETTVVLYGDKNNWFAAYAYWYLKMYGHGDVRILDGGRQKWIDEGRELTDRGAVRRSAASVHGAGARRAHPRLPRPGAGRGWQRRAARSSTCARRPSTRAS